MNQSTLRRNAIAVYLLSLLVFAVSPAAAQQPAPATGEPQAVGQTDGNVVEGHPDSQPADEAAGKPKYTLDLSNPRATIQTFLVAVQEAIADHPERIDDAVQCLDTSQLEADGHAEHARKLARRLYEVIDKKGVTLDDIPEQTEDAKYVFFELKPEEDTARTCEISLARDLVTGHWQFTAATLASIPALKESAAEEKSPKPAESKVPAARRSPRATMLTFIDAMNAEPQNLAEAVECLDPAGQAAQAWSVRGPDLAHKLKNVMNKIRLVVLPEIPDTPDGQAYEWHTSKTGNIVIGRVAEGEFKDEWRFTPKTLKTLDALYREFELEDKPIIRELQEAGVTERLTLGMRLQRLMPPALRREFLYLEGWQWLSLGALVAAGWLIRTIVAAMMPLLLRTWFRRREVEVDREVSQRALRPTGVIAAMVLWLYAIQILQLPEALLKVLLPVLKFGLAWTVVWAGYRLVDILGAHIASRKEVKLTHFDDLLIPLLRKLLRFGVILVVVLFVLDYWLDKPPTTVLGMLGIGGVALAFAAKDTLNNFFGSITVLFDRPFGIGDWIEIGNVNGTVEHVGFRSTRVRTFYNSVVTIPNSMMVNTLVDNYGARQFRRQNFMLSITYSTPPEKIDAFCEGIRELVRLHPYTRKDYYHVYFNKFAASSLDIMVYIFFQAPDWQTELRERHRLFVDIVRLARKMGVEFAFPTQTVWFQRGGAEAAEGISIVPGKDDPERIGLDQAAKVFEEAYGAEPTYRGPVVIDRDPRSKQ